MNKYVSLAIGQARPSFNRTVRGGVQNRSYTIRLGSSMKFGAHLRRACSDGNSLGCFGFAAKCKKNKF